MKDQGKKILNELEDTESSDGLAEAAVEIGGYIDEYNRLRAKATVTPELYAEACSRPRKCLR